LKAGIKRLQGDTVREATSDEVSEIRKENEQLKVFSHKKKSKNMLGNLMSQIPTLSYSYILLKIRKSSLS
jgi:hypothetical protein